MPRLKRFPIGAKLAAGFAAVLLLLVLLGVLSLGQLSSVSAGAQTFNDDVVPSVSTLDDVALAATPSARPNTATSPPPPPPRWPRSRRTSTRTPRSSSPTSPATRS